MYGNTLQKRSIRSFQASVIKKFASANTQNMNSCSLIISTFLLKDFLFCPLPLNNGAFNLQ